MGALTFDQLNAANRFIEQLNDARSK